MKRPSLSSLATHVVLLVQLGSLACSGDDRDEPGEIVTERGNLGGVDDTREATATTPASATCERGTLEADLMAAPLAGAGVDGGRLRAGEYIVSSTYLQLRPGARQTFDGLIGPLVEDLETRDGLLALSLGGSEACDALRTLSVWRDDAAMIAFVTGSAHATAMSRVTDLSRGGSLVTHWLGDEGSATWEVAARELGAIEGPLY